MTLKRDDHKDGTPQLEGVVGYYHYVRAHWLRWDNYDAQLFVAIEPNDDFFERYGDDERIDEGGSVYMSRADAIQLRDFLNEVVK